MQNLSVKNTIFKSIKNIKDIKREKSITSVGEDEFFIKLNGNFEIKLKKITYLNNYNFPFFYSKNADFFELMNSVFSQQIIVENDYSLKKAENLKKLNFVGCLFDLTGIK